MNSSRLTDPIRRATHYRDNREERRQARETARQIRSDEPAGEPGTWADVEIVDEQPEEDESLLGRQIVVATDDKDVSKLTVQLIQSADGSLQWRDVTPIMTAPAIYLDEFGSAGTGSGQFAKGIRGIAVYPLTGDVLVASGTGGDAPTARAGLGCARRCSAPHGMACVRRSAEAMDAKTGRSRSITRPMGGRLKFVGARADATGSRTITPLPLALVTGQKGRLRMP